MLGLLFLWNDILCHFDLSFDLELCYLHEIKLVLLISLDINLHFMQVI